MRGPPPGISLAHDREAAREMSERVGCWSILYFQRGVKSRKAVTIMANVCGHRRLSAASAVGALSDFSHLSHRGGLAHGKTVELRFSVKMYLFVGPFFTLKTKASWEQFSYTSPSNFENKKRKNRRWEESSRCTRSSGQFIDRSIKRSSDSGARLRLVI